jgi:tripartite-type tricarboxylate transporter receptor subunit TctC
MEMLQGLAGVRFVPVHYKGATPALTDVIAGHIQLMFISVGSAVPQWRDHKVRILAVGAARRLVGLPEVPTVAESGLPGFEAVSWFGLFGPAGLAPDVVAKLNTEVRRLFADAEFRKTFLAPQFFESIAGSPEELATYLESEAAKWGKVIRAAKIKVE